MAGGIALSRVLKFTSQLEGRHAANHMNHEHARSRKQGLTPSGDGLRAYGTERRGTSSTFIEETYAAADGVSCSSGSSSSRLGL